MAAEGKNATHGTAFPDYPDFAVGKIADHWQAIGRCNSVRYIVAWCETRDDYRHIKMDRVKTVVVLADKYPGRRETLIKGWDATMGPQR